MLLFFVERTCKWWSEDKKISTSTSERSISRAGLEILYETDGLPFFFFCSFEHYFFR